MIVIFHEDTYGKEFLKGLLERFKNAGTIPKSGFKFQKLNAMCNYKTTRLIKAYLTHNKRPSGILVIIDDDRTNGENTRREQGHIPLNLGIPITLLAFQDEIEELILYNNGISHSGKSSEYLKRVNNYKKNMLGEYVNKLNLARILSHPVIQQMVSFIQQHP